MYMLYDRVIYGLVIWCWGLITKESGQGIG